MNRTHQKITASMVVTLAFLLNISVRGDDVESVADAFKKGKLKGHVGISFRSIEQDRKDNREDEGHLGWGSVELSYQTAKLHGFSAGTSLLGVGELWGEDMWDEQFSDAGNFFTKAQLKTLYLNYAIPETKTEVLVGRSRFKKVAIMDGDVHEGIQLTLGDIPRTKIYAHIIRRWIDDISDSWDLDGIEDFTRDADDIADRAGNDAGKLIYTVIADIDVVEDKVTLTPFIIHHPDFITTYGAMMDVTIPLNEDLALGLDGGWAEYLEDTDFAGDTDAQTWIIHGQIKFGKFYVGLGHYRVSDDPNGLFQGANVDKTIGNYHFDPMKISDVGMYCGGRGGDPDDKTTYVDAGFTVGKVGVDLIYGDSSFTHGRNRTDQECKELALVVTYKFDKAFSATLGWVHQNFDDEVREPDTDYLMGGLRYKF